MRSFLTILFLLMIGVTAASAQKAKKPVVPAASTPEARSNAHLISGDYAKAIPELEKMLQSVKSEDGSAKVALHATLAGVKILNGNMADAATHLAAAEAVQFDIDFTVDMFAEEDIAEKRLGLALAKYTAMMAHRPKNPVYPSYRSDIWKKLGEPRKALADADAAIALNRRGGVFYIRKAEILMTLKQYVDALDALAMAFEWLLVDDPSIGTAYRIRAAAHCAIGDKKEAAIDEAKAISLGEQIPVRCR